MQETLLTVREEAAWDRESSANFVLKFWEAGRVVIYHPSRLLRRHLDGMCDCLADCRWSNCSRDRHDRPAADCLSTQDECIQLASLAHQVLAVAAVVVLPFLRDHLVWVPGEIGQPGIALEQRCVAGSTAAVPLPRQSCWRYYQKLSRRREFEINRSLFQSFVSSANYETMPDSGERQSARDRVSIAWLRVRESKATSPSTAKQRATLDRLVMMGVAQTSKQEARSRGMSIIRSKGAGLSAFGKAEGCTAEASQEA